MGNGTFSLPTTTSHRFAAVQAFGIAKPGEGGGLEQVGYHGLEPEYLVAAVKELVR
ncbi:MAG: hypothetical protein JO279_10970 [Verrucomicrobia bacterium]|nr:hypothetical protein [Verrucomicrobiota bacterium]